MRGGVAGRSALSARVGLGPPALEDWLQRSQPSAQDLFHSLPTIARPGWLENPGVDGFTEMGAYIPQAAGPIALLLYFVY